MLRRALRNMLPVSLGGITRPGSLGMISARLFRAPL